MTHHPRVEQVDTSPAAAEVYATVKAALTGRDALPLPHDGYRCDK